jgi:hypothetical protein
VQHRPKGALLAVAGLVGLVVVLVATPDVAPLVFAAWVIVLAGVAAVAVGIALGLRRDAPLEEADAGRPHYLTADWAGGAQLFTVGARAEPPPEEPTPEPAGEPAFVPDTPPAVLPHPPSEPEVLRYPRIAAAFMLASAIRDVIRPGRADR